MFTIIFVFGSGSNLCNTINYICLKYNFNKHNLKNTKQQIINCKLNNHVNLDEYILSNVEIIQDMLHLRETHNYSFFRKCQVDAILLTICSD